MIRLCFFNAIVLSFLSILQSAMRFLMFWRRSSNMRVSRLHFLCVSWWRCQASQLWWCGLHFQRHLQWFLAVTLKQNSGTSHSHISECKGGNNWRLTTHKHMTLFEDPTRYDPFHTARLGGTILHTLFLIWAHLIFGRHSLDDLDKIDFHCTEPYLAGKPKLGENCRNVSSPWTEPGRLFVELRNRTQLNCVREILLLPSSFFHHFQPARNHWRGHWRTGRAFPGSAQGGSRRIWGGSVPKSYSSCSFCIWFYWLILILHAIYHVLYGLSGAMKNIFHPIFCPCHFFVVHSLPIDTIGKPRVREQVSKMLQVVYTYIPPRASVLKSICGMKETVYRW